MNNIFVKVAIITVFFSPALVLAGPIIRSGESVSIDATQVLESDFYAFSPTVALSGPAEEDVYIGGGTVTINAEVSKDLTIVGGVVQVHGDVGDDLRVVGGEVTLANAVKGDLVVFGGTLTVLSTAHIEGDVVFYGGDLVLEGSVVGDVYGNAGIVRINSEVGGDVSLNVKNTFTAGDNANILGSVTYESFNDLVRSQNAVITGDISKIDVIEDSGTSAIKVLCLFLIVLIFSALTMYLALRKYIEGVVTSATKDPGILGLIGIGVFVTLPFMSGLLLVSVIGSLVGAALFIAYMLLCMFSFFGAGILLGSYVQNVLSKKTGITIGTVVTGMVLLTAIGLIPYIGGFVVFGLILVMLGGVSRALYFAVRK